MAKHQIHPRLQPRQKQLSSTHSTFAKRPSSMPGSTYGKLAFWELGNEPDLFKTSAQGIVRPSSWNEAAYIAEWLDGTRSIREVLSGACPEMATNAMFKWYAPSFAGTSNSLNPVISWQDGLDADRDISIISSHKYVALLSSRFDKTTNASPATSAAPLNPA